MSSTGLYRFATLLSQIGDDSEFVHLISLQLDHWADEGEGENRVIPAGILDLYRLLGADPFPSDTWPSGSILRDVGWVRALGMIFWYCDSLSADGCVGTLTDSLLLYDEALARGFVDPPVSPHAGCIDRLGMDVQYPGVKHGLYSLLQVLFRGPAVSEEEMEGRIVTALRSEGYTRDPLDYRAVYLVLVLLECMGLVSPRCSYAAIVRQQLIAQLVSEECWLWGVFVALQLPDDAQRSFIVKEMVLRHAVAEDDMPLIEGTSGRGKRHVASSMQSLPSLKNISTSEQVHFLVEVLHVPICWLHEAAAHRFRYAHDHFKEVQHLNFARLWDSAREVVCSELAPMVLMKSSAAGTSLLQLLESMDVEGGRLEDLWSSKSDILLSFLRLKSSVDSLVSKRGGDMEGGNDFQIGELAGELQNTACEAKLLLERVQMLNTKSVSSSSSSAGTRGKGPSIEYAALLNMGTYLFDFMDRLSRSSEGTSRFTRETDLFENVSLFESSLTDDFPVLGDHVLSSLHHHSAVMLREAASRLSLSYRMSSSATVMTVV